MSEYDCVVGHFAIQYSVGVLNVLRVKLGFSWVAVAVKLRHHDLVRVKLGTVRESRHSRGTMLGHSYE